MLIKDIESEFFFQHDKKIRHDGVFTFELHCHNLFEIYFMTEGKCRYFIDGNTYLLSEGDLVIIPAGVIHNSEYSASVHSRMLINCSADFIPNEIIEEASCTHLYRNPKTAQRISDIFAKIQNEYEKDKPYKRGFLKTYTYELFYTLLRYSSRGIPVDVTNRTVADSVSYIKDNLSSEITLSSVSKMFNLSEEHFSRLFKKETGMGFCSYLNYMRLKKAEEILTHSTETRITDIAYQCGFTDSNYFSSAFKKKYGMSPKKYQKTYR